MEARGFVTDLLGTSTCVTISAGADSRIHEWPHWTLSQDLHWPEFRPVSHAVSLPRSPFGSASLRAFFTKL
jgi:hypothetical protein